MREFSISPLTGQTVSAAITLLFVNPKAAPNPNLEFLRWWVGQYLNATSAQQPVQLETQATAFPTLASITPVVLKPSDPNASIIVGGTAGAAGTAGITATAEGAGTKTAVWNDAFNVLNGWLHVPTPAETRIMPSGYTQGLGLYFPVAPAGTTSWTWGTVFREV